MQYEYSKQQNHYVVQPLSSSKTITSNEVKNKLDIINNKYIDCIFSVNKDNSA